MATTNTWDQVVNKITGVANRGAFSRTFTPSNSAQSASGGAGYYSSVYAACNGVSLNGNATPSQVLSGYTFYSKSLTRQSGSISVLNPSVHLTSSDSRGINITKTGWSVVNSDGGKRICLLIPSNGYYTTSQCIGISAIDFLNGICHNPNMVTGITSGSNSTTINTSTWTSSGDCIAIAVMSGCCSVSAHGDFSANVRILVNDADVRLAYKFGYRGESSSSNINAGCMAFSAPFVCPSGTRVYGRVEGVINANSTNHIILEVYTVS